MNDINAIILTGRLPRDAELKYTNSGVAMVKGSISVNKSVKKDNAWINECSFFDFVYFGKVAESIHRMMTKGVMIGLNGELKQNRWKDADGQSKSKIEINVNSISIYGKQKKENEQNSVQEENNFDLQDDSPF